MNEIKVTASAPASDAPATTEVGVAPSALEFVDVSKAFLSGDQGMLALHGVTYRVPRGRFVCLLGPSGCGKSTLLNLAAGLTQPSTGRVLFDGAPLTGVNHEAGFITQKDNLLPWRTVTRNVGIALEVRRLDKRTRKERIRQMIELVGLKGFEDHYPSQLSGGMRKRVTLARTLIYEPSTLLMDEPFAALDAQLRAAMQAELLRLWERDRKTVLFVTHDVQEALLLADEIIVFSTRPGRIVRRQTVTFPRPRRVEQLATDPVFLAAERELWDVLGTDAAGGE